MIKTSVLDFTVKAFESDDPNKKAETEFTNDLKGIEDAIKTDFKISRDFRSTER